MKCSDKSQMRILDVIIMLGVVCIENMWKYLWMIKNLMLSLSISVVPYNPWARVVQWDASRLLCRVSLVRLPGPAVYLWYVLSPWSSENSFFFFLFLSLFYHFLFTSSSAPPRGFIQPGKQAGEIENFPSFLFFYKNFLTSYLKRKTNKSMYSKTKTKPKTIQACSNPTPSPCRCYWHQPLIRLYTFKATTPPKNPRPRPYGRGPSRYLANIPPYSVYS